MSNTNSSTFKPFKEQGHYVSVHDAIFDVLMPITPPNAWKVICLILRKTRGWQKDEDAISYDQIMKGTGIGSSATVRSALKWLSRNKLILEVKEHGQTTRYKLHEDYEMPRTSLETKDPGNTATSSETKEGTSTETKDTITTKQEPLYEESLRSSSADQPPSKNGSKKKEKTPKPKSGVTKLMDRVNAARERGANVQPLINSKRGEFGQFYKQAILDGHLPENCDLALDYMVAKASGQIPEEPKAWCGFGTALDTVELEGWRPKGAQGGRATSEADKEWEREQEKMWQEMQEAKKRFESESKERTDG